MQPACEKEDVFCCVEICYDLTHLAFLLPVNTYSQDEWTRCIGSGYQKDSLYRTGRFGKQ